MKKTISLILIILAVMTVLPACSGAAKAIDFPFIDVKTGEWYYDNVKYVFEKGIMKGTSDTSFSPEGSLSRAMCVTILHRCAGEPETSENVKFRDVKSGEYYEKAVGWASDRGIVKGKSETEFAPDDQITRAEFSFLSPASRKNRAEIISARFAV